MGSFCIPNLIFKDVLCHSTKGMFQELMWITFNVLPLFQWFCLFFLCILLFCLWAFCFSILTCIFNCFTCSTEQGYCLIVYACSAVILLATSKGEGCSECLFLCDFPFDAFFCKWWGNSGNILGTETAYKWWPVLPCLSWKYNFSSEQYTNSHACLESSFSI